MSNFSSLIGYETSVETCTLTDELIIAFVDAIGDKNPIFRDRAAAQAAGYAAIPAPPTLPAHLRNTFDQRELLLKTAGLDLQSTILFHGQQEYAYTRQLYSGESITSSYRLRSLQQIPQDNKMMLVVFEQNCDTEAGEHIATGKATTLLQELTHTGESRSIARREKGVPRQPIGQVLPAITKYVTQAQINAYAALSRDENPIHLDPEIARAAGLGGTVAHGMLCMAFSGQVLTDWLTKTAPHDGVLKQIVRLRATFQAFVHPGDILTCDGTLTRQDAISQQIRLRVRNQSDESVLKGDALLALSPTSL